MKALPLILATSLVANAAWLAGTLLRPADTTVTPDGVRHDAASGHNISVTTGDQKPTAAISPKDRPLAHALQSGTPEELRDALRAAGVQDEIVRQLVSSRIWKRYETRMRALQNTRQPDPAIWWKNPDHNNDQTREQRDEMQRLQKEIQAENERLLGESWQTQNNPWLERQYGFLPAEKRQLLQKTEQDYNELIGEINRQARGFQLPSDQEQLSFLQQEKRRDLETLLTPDELRDYDLRNSNTAGQLRWKMTQMNASEEEYLTIYALQKKFDDIYNPQDPFANGQVERDQEYWKQRREAEKVLNQDIRTTIGDERYREYVMSNDHGYQQLKAATLRLELPEDTPAKVYALRESIPQSANAIADDEALSDEQKRAQLAALAETARNDIRAQLGSEAAEVILKNSSFNWIKELEKGTIISHDVDGQRSTRRLPKPKKN